MLGLNLKTFNTPLPTSDYFKAIVEKGFSLIIAVGYGWGDIVETLAEKHPNVHFVLLDQRNPDFVSYETLPNITSLFFREDEAGFIAGALAGCTSVTGIIGAIGSNEAYAGEFIDGFTKGARYANADITVLTEYTDNFIDKNLAKEKANLVIAQGADILYAVVAEASDAVIETAYTSGIASIGAESNQFVPSYGGFIPFANLIKENYSIMGSTLKNVKGATYDAVLNWHAKTLTSGFITYSMENNGVAFMTFTAYQRIIPIPSHCASLKNQVRRDLIDGIIILDEF